MDTSFAPDARTATPRAHGLSGSAAELVGEIREISNLWLGERVRGALAALDDLLFELAVHAAEPADQTRYFEAMRRLRADVDAVAQAFTTHHAPGFEVLLGGDRHTPAHAPASEALTRHRRQAEVRHEGALGTLSGLLNALFADYRTEPGSGPLAPRALLDAWVATLAAAAMPDGVQARALDCFARRVLDDLDELCARCAGVLVDAGIRPWQALPAAGVAEAPDNRLPRAPVLSLLDKPAPAPRLELPQRELVQALSELQRLLVAQSQPSPAAVEDLVRHHCELHARKRGRAIAARDARTVRAVALLFASIREDLRVPAQIGALLARLHLPVLRIALRDSALFGDDGHPVRALLNGIGELATGWRPAAGGHAGSLHEQLARLVDGIACGWNGGLELFEQALPELDALLLERQAAARVAERRTETAEHALSLSASGQVAVEHLLREHLDGLQLPAAAEEILREGWCRVMLHAHLRAGSDGDLWRDSVGVFHRFLALWDGNCYGLPSAIAEALRDGLAVAGCDPLRTEILLASISEELPRHEPAPREARAGAAAVAAQPAIQVQYVDPDTFRDGDAIDVDGIAVGSWFAFRLQGFPDSSGKLLCRVGASERLVFVDGSGAKLLSVTRDEMLAALTRGSVLEIDETPLFDRALARLSERLDADSARQPKLKCVGAKD